jgi:hypothetical protein
LFEDIFGSISSRESSVKWQPQRLSGAFASRNLRDTGETGSQTATTR